MSLTTTLDRLRKNDPTLTSVSLSASTFSDEAAAQLATTLKTNRALTHLDLSHNPLTAAAVTPLLSTLRSNQTLTALTLTDTQIDPSSLKALSKPLRRNQKITCVWAKIWIGSQQISKAIQIAKNLSPHAPQEAITIYKLILTQAPEQWDLYQLLAQLYSEPSHQAHILLKGAWCAMEKGKYKVAQTLSEAAYKCHPASFLDRALDFELLIRQNKQTQIAPTLLRFADHYARLDLPQQELEASLLAARLKPEPGICQRIITLHTRLGKPAEAIQWIRKLTAISKPQALPTPILDEIDSKSNEPKLLSSIAFGKEQWATYFGDIGEEPPLPPNIEQILTAPCPFWKRFYNNKKVQETHVLILIPETVDGKPLTLKRLGELVQRPKKGVATKYKYIDSGEYIDSPAPKSHWVLMTRDVLPGSRRKSSADQYVLVCYGKSRLPYEIPPILDATVCIFMEYFRTGKRLYDDSPWSPRTRTRCREDVPAFSFFKRVEENRYNRWHLAVGEFGPDGLVISSSPEGIEYENDTDGAGGLRKF